LGGNKSFNAESRALLPGFSSRRQVFETQCFTEQLARLGDIRRLDEAIAPIQLILTENAEVFPVVRGHQRIRLAKTRPVDTVPAMNIWYMIDEQDESVLLLYIEPSLE
jgi:hypothetical protein